MEARLITPLWREVDPRAPGSSLNLAIQKRLFEKKLRADGWSKAAAIAEVGKRYKDRNYA